MAYRRRQGISRSSTFKEEFHDPSLEDVHVKDSNHDNASPSIFSSSSSTPASSLAAQAIKATASRHQPSLSFAFAPAESDHQRSKVLDAECVYLFALEQPLYQQYLSSISHDNFETLHFVY